MERMAPPGTWNRERVITALRDWAREFGEPPRVTEWGPPESAPDASTRQRAQRWAAEHPRWPSPETVAKYLDSWSAALEEAGLRKRRVGPWELNLPGRVAAARMMSARGKSASSIAAELNVTPHTARTYLRAWPCPECGGPVVSAKAKSCAACRSKRHTPAWTREEMLEAIRLWTREEGEPPRIDEWRPGAELAERWEREWPRWPSTMQVQWQFDRWRDALEAAGVDASAHKPYWDRDSIRTAFEEFAGRYGRGPGRADLEASGSELPSGSTVCEYFGSIEAAREAAGLPDPYASPWDRETIVAAIRAAQAANGRPPTQAEWRETTPDHPSVPVVLARFDSWTQALHTAGVTPARLPWDREAILGAMRRFAAEQGRPPSAGDWRRRDPHGRWPNQTTVTERFGSWRDALVAAGFSARPQWSREEILTALRTFARQHGRPPLSRELNPAHGLPSFETVSGRFGSIAASYEAAGIGSPARRRWDRASVIAALQAFEHEHGRPPTQQEWRKKTSEHPGAGTIDRMFGSWTAAKAAAGLSTRRGRWDRERIVSTLRAWATEHERNPRPNEWHEADPSALRPSASSVTYHFGSWEAALEAAEL